MYPHSLAGSGQKQQPEKNGATRGELGNISHGVTVTPLTGNGWFNNGE